MFLSGLFRETRAHELLLRFGNLPRELLNRVCGDFLENEFQYALEQTVESTNGIRLLIQNRDADQRVRLGALESIERLVGSGRLQRPWLSCTCGTCSTENWSGSGPSCGIAWSAPRCSCPPPSSCPKSGGHAKKASALRSSIWKRLKRGSRTSGKILTGCCIRHLVAGAGPRSTI